MRRVFGKLAKIKVSPLFKARHIFDIHTIQTRRLTLNIPNISTNKSSQIFHHRKIKTLTKIWLTTQITPDEFRIQAQFQAGTILYRTSMKSNQIPALWCMALGWAIS
ncbi:hypothetical protein DA83_25560 [Pseudomonas sp. 250J]|nr:hypothetical protein DA83_25560 [Pseudomonas sp. 250J]